SSPHSCSRLRRNSKPTKMVSLGSLAREVRLMSRSASFTFSAKFHTEITVASLSRYTVADTSWGSSSIRANTVSMSAKLAKAQHFIPGHRILSWICFSPVSSMASRGMVGHTSGSDLNLFGGWEKSSEEDRYLWAIVRNWESRGKKATSLEEVSTVMCSKKRSSSARQIVVGRAIRSWIKSPEASSDLSSSKRTV
ncbi:hypothetical protein K5549_021417, partial [Capra hircus]